MTYKITSLHSLISIKKIVSIHYFEYMSDFHFPGESHDFWELVCVDKGIIDVMADDRRLPLKRGNMIFHAPGQFHNIITNGTIAPNLVVIGFVCHSPSLLAFKDQILTVQESEQALLARIIIEARNAFQGRLNDPYQEVLTRSSDPVPFGAEQLISSYLEELIIHLYRRYYDDDSHFSDDPVHPAQAGVNQTLSRLPVLDGQMPGDTYHRVIRYMETHLYEQLNLDTICRDNLTGRSKLQKLFRQVHGCGVIAFFTAMKIDTAKQLIRNNKLNFTEISDRLGYNSIHYFSRQFKQVTGMTPTEYSASIRSLSDKPQQKKNTSS